jgi:aspartyl-tRNA(Asn)/glutamyl-tRNA(Gln) amidotransferase subunit A
MEANDLAFMTVAELAPLIASRKLSPVELVDAQLARIEALDGVLRAFITVDVDNARRTAMAMEAEIMAGSYRGPLHGVTVAHKDIIDVRGLPTTAASKIMQGYVAERDATVAARLRAAGTICLGKLNLIEFASGSMGLYGFARNPYNLGASPGASSSGSGVAAAAGLATLVTGTDTGGSVRNPSGFCGIAGLRPTYGRVSRFGCVPLSWSQDSIGPMGRSVYDVATMLCAIAGADIADSTAAQAPVPDYTKALTTDLAGLRIGVPDTFYFEDLDADIERSMHDAIEVMRGLGAQVSRVSLPASVHAGAASWTIAYSEAFAYHRTSFEERAKDYTPAFYHKITAAGLASAEERVVSQRIRQVVTREFGEAMRGVDIIVTPGSRSLASEPGRGGDVASVTRPVSLAGYPALSLPIGFGSDNTPIGMQVIGRPWEEATVFRAGHAYERVTEWHKRRPPTLPQEVPPPYGANLPAPTAAPDALVSPAWVIEMARLLDYGFIEEEDAPGIASLLSPIKARLNAARDALLPEQEPPTRAAGAY